MKLSSCYHIFHQVHLLFLEFVLRQLKLLQENLLQHFLYHYERVSLNFFLEYVEKLH